jgi:hypothetical protein
VNAQFPGTRALIEFRGPVQVRGGCGAVTLLMRGCEAPAPERRRREFTELAFAAAHAEPLPAVLRDARVFGPEQGPDLSPGRFRYRIEAAGCGADGRIAWSAEVLAASVQLHREAASAFFGAVPPPHLPLTRRFGWLALLSVLRVPGAMRIVQRFRGTT